jgi:hypothetical protein
MSDNDQFLRIVKDGRLRILLSEHAVEEPVRLTTIAMPVPMPPELKEIHLTEYEGQALMVRGHYGGGWIYAAEVIDRAGPILTALVRRVFA